MGATAKFQINCQNCEIISTVFVNSEVMDTAGKDIINAEFCPFCGDVLDETLDFDDDMMYDEEDLEE